MLIDTLPQPVTKEPTDDVVRFIRLGFADEKLPTFKENRGSGITFYGDKNDYPEKLIYLYNRSPKHNAIITRKAKFITGKETTIEGYPTLEKAWNPNDSLKQFKFKIILDKRIFGALAIEVCYNMEQVPTFYHINTGKIRTLDHKSYQYWKDGAATKKKDVEFYDAFDPANIVKETDKDSPNFGKYKKQIIYIREYRADMGVYALPDYIGCQQYIDIDTRISNFHLNNISSGFTGGTLIQFAKGEPTPEMAREIKRRFKGNYGGDSAAEAGGMILQFNSATETPATITPLTPNEMDKQFLTLNDHVQQEIFVGHGVTSPMLFGVRVEGQLGGRSELADAYEIYYKDCIEREQIEIDELIETLLSYKNINAKVTTTKFEPVAQDWVSLFASGLVDKVTAQEALGLPVEQAPQQSDVEKLNTAINNLSPLVANKVINELSTNEVRRLANLPPVEGGDGKSLPADTPAAFKLDYNDETELEKFFTQYGEPETNYEYLKFSFAKLNENEVKIMSLINSNEKANVQEISDATKIAQPEVEKILKELEKSSKINWTDNKISITDYGKKSIDNIGGFDNLVLRYKYAVSPEAEPLQTHSRPFCKKLMDLNRVYSREDIDKMSAILGYDVWNLRGGWYHNPATDVNIPHCRHEWHQKIMKKK